MLSRSRLLSEVQTYSFLSIMAASISKTLKISRAVPTIPKLAPVFSSFSTSERNIQPPSIGEAAVASQTKERGGWSKLLLFVPGALTFGLGTWQIFRRQEKIKMLDYRRGRLEMEPIRWNEIGGSLGHNLNSLEFRKVICEGVFDEGKSLFVGPRSRSISGVTENGYYVISPFIPKAGESGR